MMKFKKLSMMRWADSLLDIAAHYGCFLIPFVLVLIMYFLAGCSSVTPTLNESENACTETALKEYRYRDKDTLISIVCYKE